ncbi:MAG: TadE/TadG family type IV pilus assembly protein [Solirubrobacteraceae bacterium]
MKRLGSAVGQASVEFGASIGLVIIAALAAWQLALAGWTAVSAENAARTAARAYSRSGDQGSAATDAHESLQGDGLDTGAKISFDGGTAKVVVKIPIVVPGIPSPVHISDTADMPSTG